MEMHSRMCCQSWSRVGYRPGKGACTWQVNVLLHIDLQFTAHTTYTCCNATFHFHFVSADEKELVLLLMKFFHAGFPLKVKAMSSVKSLKGRSCLAQRFSKVQPRSMHQKEISVNWAMCTNKPTIDKVFLIFHPLYSLYSLMFLPLAIALPCHFSPQDYQ